MSPRTAAIVLVFLFGVMAPTMSEPAPRGEVEYRSAHILLRAPRGESVGRVLEELEDAYGRVRAFGLDLPQQVRAVAYRSTADYVRGAGGSSYQLALAREGVIHLQPLRLLMRRADLGRAVRHELVHVSLLPAALKGLPRWFNEGVAMTVAGEKLPVAGSFRSLEALEDTLLHARGYATVRGAYGASERLVAALDTRLGRRGLLSLTRSVAAGTPFAQSFRAAVGEEPERWGLRALRF